MQYTDPKAARRPISTGSSKEGNPHDFMRRTCTWAKKKSNLTYNLSEHISSHRRSVARRGVRAVQAIQRLGSLYKEVIRDRQQGKERGLGNPCAERKAEVPVVQVGDNRAEWQVVQSIIADPAVEEAARSPAEASGTGPASAERPQHRRPDTWSTDTSQCTQYPAGSVNPVTWEDVDVPEI